MCKMQNMNARQGFTNNYKRRSSPCITVHKFRIPEHGNIAKM